MNASKIARIARRIMATFSSRWDPDAKAVQPAGVMDVAPNSHRAFVSPGFKSEWQSLFSKFSRDTPEARENINEYYRESLKLIKSGVIGKNPGGIEIKYLNFVPSKGGGRFFECKQQRINGTSFSPRIFFVNVSGTGDSILLDVMDKNGNNIPASILNGLSGKFKTALADDYQNNYSQN